MRKKILILGANGMLGSSLYRYFIRQNHEVIGTVRSHETKIKLAALGMSSIHTGVDAFDTKSILNIIQETKPNVIFNCIGIIKQQDAVNNYANTIQINSLLPHTLAQIATEAGARLIHFSTDCVFSGEGNGLYTENDLEDAVDLYGRSKLLGEVTYAPHLTLRTSIIGHEIDSSISLVDWFLSQKQPVNGYSNAIFSGLPTCYVAEVIDQFVLNNPDLVGLYHLSVAPINKHDLLSLINDTYGNTTKIHDYSEFKVNKSLNSCRFAQDTGYKAPEWPMLIKKMHDEFIDYFKD